MSREIHVGMRVQAAENIDLLPHALISMGETGIIVGTVSEGGIEGVEVLWDETHPGLGYWQNKSLLVDPEIEALFPAAVEFLRELQPSVDLCVLSEFEQRRSPWRTVMKWVAVVLALVAATYLDPIIPASALVDFFDDFPIGPF